VQVNSLAAVLARDSLATKHSVKRKRPPTVSAPPSLGHNSEFLAAGEQ
jgi:hypothetical protein